MLKKIQARIKKIYANRFICWKMALSMFKAKYIGLKLGIWMAVLNPLLVMFAIAFVFVQVFNVDIENFQLFVLSGIFPWIFFSGALSEVAASITSKQSLLHQYNFAREVLPLASIISNFLTFLVGWVVMLPIFFAYKPEIIWMLPWLVVLLALFLFFVSGLGMAVAILNALSRDVEQLLGVIMMLWFWMTPIFYSRDMVPAPYRIICSLNPMTPFIVFFRQILVSGTLPSLFIMLSVLVVTASAVGIGLLAFALLERKLSKEI